MNSDQPSPESRTEARAEEAAAIRRRWLSLGEILAVLAVSISALTLWLNWMERSDSQQEKVVESSHAAKKAATLMLSAQPSSSGDRIDLRPISADQQVQEQTILFPDALGIAPVETAGEPRIEARWFEDALKKAREKSGMPDNSRGDERMPVVIKTRFLVDGGAHEDAALYDLGYTIKGRMLTGHVLALRGLSFVKHVTAASAPESLKLRASRLFPTPAS
jgi:hypothetical protein